MRKLTSSSPQSLNRKAYFGSGLALSRLVWVWTNDDMHHRDENSNAWPLPVFLGAFSVLLLQTTLHDSREAVQSKEALPPFFFKDIHKKQKHSLEDFLQLLHLCVSPKQRPVGTKLSSNHTPTSSLFSQLYRRFYLQIQNNIPASNMSSSDTKSEQLLPQEEELSKDASSTPHVHRGHVNRVQQHLRSSIPECHHLSRNGREYKT